MASSNNFDQIPKNDLINFFLHVGQAKVKNIFSLIFVVVVVVVVYLI
jgi:hypothetical protein